MVHMFGCVFVGVCLLRAEESKEQGKEVARQEQFWFTATIIVN
jgi:hypothetical protein